jgi:small subunit ribosomal protein S9
VNDEQTPPEDTPETPPAPEPTPAEDTSPSEAPGASDTDREAEASRASASETDVSSEALPEGEPSAQEEPEAPAEQPAPAAEESPVLEEEGAEEVELPPRQRPEIPGADLIPDIPLAEDDEFLDAEARAAAEAEAEARAAREREQHEDVETRPIADAAIDLAAGARYTATGKRKTSVARVILKPGSGAYAINGKPLDTYFPRETLRRVIRQPLESVGYDSRMDVVARMHGGGVAAQAEALRHGISRALIVADPHLRGELKRRGFLTRDPRVKERKKAGLKKARKRPQFSKR